MNPKPILLLTLTLVACDTAPVDVSDLHNRERAVPTPSACAPRDAIPLDAPEGAYAARPRTADLDEENHGLAMGPMDPTDHIELGLTDPGADPSVGVVAPNQLMFRPTDSDKDCLPDFLEAAVGTNPNDPDSDDDGWFDGPCNERRHLILTRIFAHDEQEDAGKDEFYLIADDVRHPHADLDDFWRFNHGDSMNFDRAIAQRTRGTNTGGALAVVKLSGWEDDFQVANTWKVDDLLFSTSIDLGAYDHGQVFTVRKTYSDWDYALTFRVEIERFADPDPTDSVADGDHDGISDVAEWLVARDFGGINDPDRADLLIELDWMSGRGLKTQAKRLVTTRYAMNGYNMVIKRQGTVPTDTCLTLTEARNLYKTRFNYENYNAFRYAVMSNRLWNDASGVAIGDAFLVDDSTFWIRGSILAQAGTFIHEVGHTVSLTQKTFRLIDTQAWFSYDSAMNYTYQATKVDYSDDGAGGQTSDHDDWADVDPAHALRYAFGNGSSADDGVCD